MGIVKVVVKTIGVTVTALVVYAVVVRVFLPRARQWISRRVLAEYGYIEGATIHAARTVGEVATLPAELRESSGVAVSRAQSGILWSHNDSGDGPTLYAIDLNGRLLGTFPVANAEAVDWEDIASGPCPAAVLRATDRSSPSCLYIADTGNNARQREVVTVYVVLEPVLNKAGTPPPATFARGVHFRYPDQPHDAEAVAVRADGDVTIVSKGQTGTIEFYGIAAATVAQALGSKEVVTAEFRGNTGIAPRAPTGRLVTGAALSPDGRTLAVRTYHEVFFYQALAGGRWQDLMRPCSLGDAEPQGEGIDYLDAKTLILTSETSYERSGTLHRVRC